MEDKVKTFVFGNDGSQSTANIVSLLYPLMQRQGIDPNVLAAFMNNRNDGYGEGMWFIWIWFMMMFCWGNNGFGNGFGSQGGFANMLNNDTGRQFLAELINGNGQAINSLATSLHCDVNAIQTTLNQMSSQVQQVGSQVGLSGQQVINAIQQGNMALGQQIATGLCDVKTQMSNCCCDIKDGITRSNYENQISNLNQTNTLQSSINAVNNSVERAASNIAFETKTQTCDLQNTINQGIQRVIDGQNAAMLREKEAIISRQNEEISTYKTAGIIGQQLNPITGALAQLQSEVNAIKCAQPSTVTLPNPCAVAVPACAAYGFSNSLFNGYNSYGQWA